MRWYRRLYVGKTARRDRYKIIGKIRWGKPQLDTYVITLPSNPQNILDIYPSYVLLQAYFKRQDFLILGIARGYEEALDVAAEILMETYQKTGNFHVTEYVEQ